MTKTMTMKIEEMKQLVVSLEAGMSWEACCGYSIEGELDQFINLNEETQYSDELKYA